MNRIVRKPDFISDVEKLKTKPELSAARKEYEGIQLILLGHPDKDIKINNISISECRDATSGDAIPRNAITIGKIGDVESEKPDIPVPFVGKFPDPIFEGTTNFILKKQEFMPVFLKVNIDAVAPRIFFHNANNLRKEGILSSICVIPKSRKDTVCSIVGYRQ